MALLTKDQITNALTRMGELAQQHRQTIELLVVGGAAMVLAYNARLATRDVDEQVRALSAAFLELFAKRADQLAPAWTAKIGPVAQPIFLLKAAQRMKRLRELCEAESPEPLRRRHLYATPNYLEFV